MNAKSKVNPQLIMLLFAAAAIVVGNHILKASGIISLFIFLTGYFLIFLGTWKLLFSRKTKRLWLNGLLLLFVGVFVMFLSMWLPSLLYIL